MREYTLSDLSEAIEVVKKFCTDWETDYSLVLTHFGFELQDSAISQEVAQIRAILERGY